MKKQFNEYMETEAPIQLKVLFHEMDESQAIMLQECFHAFAKNVVSELKLEKGKLSNINKSVCLKCGCGGNLELTEDGLVCDVCG